MSPPRRRSSRLRGTPKPFQHVASNLGSLEEREETPNSARFNLDSSASSPQGPQTPATAPPKPSVQDMHPSRTHQSTTKEPDSGLRLGFTNIQKRGDDQPSGVAQQSPTKAGISATFDFRFARPGAQLGSEAQRMMDELREEALKIKAKMAAEKELEKRRLEEEERQAGGSTVAGRKFAKPKGKAGRFSDVHMAEFKKMDSIAGHPSSFRAQPNYAKPTGSLKRTQSKANLDDGEENNTLPQSRKPQTSDRLENAAPAKRARKAMADDASSSRPVSRGRIPKPSTPKHPRPANFLAAISTPTQASLARSAAVKTPSSQIPTLARSPSKPNLVSGIARPLPKSATSDSISTLPQSSSKATLRSPSKFERVKSILRKVSSPGKKQVAPQTSMPSLRRSPSKPDLASVFPKAPTTPIRPNTATGQKQVNFAPGTANEAQAAVLQNSPSPMKSGIPRSASKANLKGKAIDGTTKLTQDKVFHPSIVSNPNSVQRSHEVEYPSLSGVRPLPLTKEAVPARPPPSVPSEFTFRSDHTISFGASPKGFGATSGQASVRQVRPSIAPSMPGSYPEFNKENSKPLPSVPHGMANKKRRRADSDDETDEGAKRSPKKQKPEVAEGAMLMAPRLIATPKSKLPTSPAKKGVLSLSRLNMLARPKMRK
ncbi:hypothetical protein HYFRA_00007084 [Hymenoscyphus fraxineus]|uniref:Erythromycin esterase n=1 Tax=Hymenoscyphus fraxineus TaxID=746836 RepID=A0A9N9PTD0_9HELO|nr:hypothetical protein HYFRA_00007084 [Hymenoscyphus fraxineus]